MAESPAERVVARVFGGTVSQSATAAGPASYDGLGRRFVFRPAAGDGAVYALDVEPRDAPMPDVVVMALGAASNEEAARLWTEMEVRAKLSGAPIVDVLRGSRARDARVLIRRADCEEYWIAVGQRI